MTDYAYTRGQIFDMESIVLNTIGFRVGSPTSNSFIECYLKRLETLCGGVSPNIKVSRTAKFLSNLQIAHAYDVSLQFTPSCIAAACIYVASIFYKMDGHPRVNPDNLGEPWDDVFVRATGYNEVALVPCRDALLSMWYRIDG